MNEPLRRALLHARLREEDLAAILDVDPKTVRRWLSGRVPYSKNRAAIAEIVGVGEAELWPEAGGPLTAKIRPDELGMVYPQRRAIPRKIWAEFFSSAEHEIDILAYSAVFLAQDESILRILAAKSREGVSIRIALADPDNRKIAEHDKEEGISEAVSAKVRSALALYRPLADAENVEIRLHQVVLYNSIYRADDQLLVNQHTYGTPVARSPVFYLTVNRGRRDDRRLPRQYRARVGKRSAPNHR